MLAHALVGLFVFVLGNASARSAPFQNLGFDEVDGKTTVDLGGFRGGLGLRILPGWRAWTTSTMGSSDFSAWMVLVDSLQPLPPVGMFTTDIHQRGLDVPVEGNNSLVLVSRQGGFLPRPEFAFLAQTGDVPMNANSFHFLSYDQPVELYLNRTYVPLIYRQRSEGPILTYDVYADVSAFSGQTVELIFTTPRLADFPNVALHGLDSLSFSPEVIPEPVSWIMLSLGLVMLAAVRLAPERVTGGKQ